MTKSKFELTKRSPIFKHCGLFVWIQSNNKVQKVLVCYGVDIASFWTLFIASIEINNTSFESQISLDFIQ